MIARNRQARKQVLRTEPLIKIFTCTLRDKAAIHPTYKPPTNPQQFCPNADVWSREQTGNLHFQCGKWKFAQELFCMFRNSTKICTCRWPVLPITISPSIERISLVQGSPEEIWTRRSSFIHEYLRVPTVYNIHGSSDPGCFGFQRYILNQTHFKRTWRVLTFCQFASLSCLNNVISHVHALWLSQKQHYQLFWMIHYSDHIKTMTVWCC